VLEAVGVTTLVKHAPAARPPARPAARTANPRLEIVIPVHNEERALRDSVTRLHRRLVDDVDVPFRLTIADNASTDRTAEIARTLAAELAGVRYLRIEQKGRGRALRAAWSASDAEVLAYMDVDLSTDLVHLPALLDPLLAEEADIAIGSRLAPGAQVVRGLKRAVISRSYNALLGVVLGAGFSDAQCGFKAARREAIRALLPLIEDEGWFFDTELLYLAQRNAFSIHEVPVRWVDDTDSRVHIARTVLEDLKGIARLRRRTREGHDRISTPADAVSAKPATAGAARLSAPHQAVVRLEFPHSAT
jgi:glycosyltransferase involved in cell wall biosynthesis